MWVIRVIAIAPGVFILGIAAAFLSASGHEGTAASVDTDSAGGGTGTPTATIALRTVQLSKEDAETGERLPGWELIAYRGPTCDGHPINDAFTGTEPVPMQLQEGVYSVLETLRPGWVNVTALCQAVDLTTSDGALVFRNRLLSPPGDADCDGIVTSVDAAVVLQFSAHLIDAFGCKLQADVYDDGVLNSLDALLILQDVAGLIDLTEGHFRLWPRSAGLSIVATYGASHRE